jgi:integrase
MPLTDVACRNAKPAEKPRKLADSKNLYLLVQPNGSRLWRMNYRYEGKQKTLAFGRYPEIGLGEARRRRDAAKALLEEGRDPSNADVEGEESFEQVAREWLAAQRWKSSHGLRVISRVEADLFPQFGYVAVAKLDAPTILKALRKIEERGAMEIAKRMRQTVGQIMRYAIATGRADRDPAADLKGALKPSPRVRSMAALRDRDLPEFFTRLLSYDGDTRTRLAVEFVMHTFVRTNELRFAKWSEFEGDLWRIPAERMKMGREHLVPLTRQSMAILNQLRTEDEWVCRMSENTMLFCLYRIGYHRRATVHGFRSTASTVLNESGLWNPDAVERQLAHADNTIRGVYNAAQYLPERRRMMEWWSDYLDERGACIRSQT